MAGRDVGAQLYDDHAGRGFEDQRILRIGAGGSDWAFIVA